MGKGRIGMIPGTIHTWGMCVTPRPGGLDLPITSLGNWQRLLNAPQITLNGFVNSDQINPSY